MARMGHGRGRRACLTSRTVTTLLFTGSPRLLVRSLPWALGVVLLKLLIDSTSWKGLELSPLLTAAVAAEVFIVGFMLTGTTSDFKEAERLPGEVAASLETMADEALITWRDLALPEARDLLAQLLVIGESVRLWLLRDRGLDDVMTELRGLNEPFRVIAPQIQAGFTTRLKGEQHNLRRVVLRMDTIRRTSYVAAGYLMAEVTAVILVVVMLCTDLGATVPTLALVGLISYVLVYLLSLIRDLDNPFEYAAGRPGAADVDLGVLERSEARIRVELALLVTPPPAPAPVEPPAPAAYAATAEALDPPV